MIRVLRLLILGAIMLVILPIVLIVVIAVLGPFMAQYAGMERYGMNVVDMIAVDQAILFMGAGGILIIPVGILLTIMIARKRRQPQAPRGR